MLDYEYSCTRSRQIFVKLIHVRSSQSMPLGEFAKRKLQLKPKIAELRLPKVSPLEALTLTLGVNGKELKTCKHG